MKWSIARRFIWVFTSVALVTLLWWVVWSVAVEKPSGQLTAVSPQSSAGAAKISSGNSHTLTTLRMDASGRLIPVPEPYPVQRTLHPVAEESLRINRRETSPAEDLEILQQILEAYQRAMHRHPAGENSEIVAAWMGNNPLGLLFIPTNHPAIRVDGQLIDRWGTPFFFHSLSATKTEIMSAGPDRKLWTADDIRSEM